MSAPSTHAPDSHVARARDTSSLGDEVSARGATWRGILVLAILLACFFAEPLTRFTSAHYSSADLTQGYAWTSVEPHTPANRFLSDPVVQMQPWLMFNRDSLHRAELPLWNPHNGGGVPHLANYQSAVFSPFSWPFYVMSFRAALLASAFLKLFGLGLFTFLFLRELRLGWLAALAGATVFTFSGQNVLLLSYPHTAANIALPAGLFFVERAIRRCVAARSSGSAASASRSSFWPLVGVCASLTAGLLAGQPEPAYFACIAVAIYAVGRLFIAWSTLGRTTHALREIATIGIRLGTAAVIALGIAALQLLPFLEYLEHSHVLELRSSVQTPLKLRIWPLLFFPDLVGNPSGNFQFDDSIPPPDFETANMVYGGCVALFTALVALAFMRARRAIAFAAAAAFLWFCYAYDLAGVGRLIGKLPIFSVAPINRSHAIWHLCIACLSAFALQQAITNNGRRRFVKAGAIVAIAATLFALVQRGSDSYAEALFRSVRFMKIERSAFDAWREPHVAFITWTTALGVMALAAMWAVRANLARTVLGLVVVAAMFLQTGWLFRGYNPTTPDRFFFPRTPSVELLARHVGDDYVAIMDDDTIPPASNAVYGISTIASYDAMWIRQYDRLYRECFGERNRWRTPYFGSARALQLFGVDWIATKGPWIRIDTPFARIPWNPGAFYKVGEILPGAEVAQTFHSSRDQLDAVLLLVSTYNRANTCTLNVVLEDASSRDVLARQSIDSATLVEDGSEQTQIVFSFPRLSGMRARALTLRLTSPDAVEEKSAVTVWARRDFKYWEHELIHGVTPPKTTPGAPESSLTPSEWKKSTIAVDPIDPSLPRGVLTRGTEELAGGLIFDVSPCFSNFERVAETNGLTLYRFDDAASRFHVASSARYVRSDDEAFAAVRARDFDPRKEAVVLFDGDAVHRAEPRDGALAQEDARPLVERLEEAPTRIRLRTTLAAPGHLVTACAWYPGWKARVNGVERLLVRVNYAFLGLDLAAGTHEIELVYEPESVRTGLWISSLSLLAGALWCAVRLASRTWTA